MFEAYDEILEQGRCPACGHEGVDADGTGYFSCSECGYEGSIDELCD